MGIVNFNDFTRIRTEEAECAFLRFAKNKAKPVV